jgi:hypothetical protein
VITSIHASSRCGDRGHFTHDCTALGVSISEQLLLQGELPDETHGSIALRESNLHDICG